MIHQFYVLKKLYFDVWFFVFRSLGGDLERLYEYMVGGREEGGEKRLQKREDTQVKQLPLLFRSLCIIIYVDTLVCLFVCLFLPPPAPTGCKLCQ